MEELENLKSICSEYTGLKTENEGSLNFKGIVKFNKNFTCLN